MRIDNTLTPGNGQPNFGKPFDKFLTKFVPSAGGSYEIEAGDLYLLESGDTYLLE